MARIRGFTNRSNDAVGFIITGNFPAVIVYKTSESTYTTIQIKGRVLSKIFDDEQKEDRQKSNDYYESHARRQNTHYAIVNLVTPIGVVKPFVDTDANNPAGKLFADAIHKYPKAFVIKSNLSKHDIFQLLCVEMQIPANSFESRFGEIDHSHEDSTGTKINSCTFFFPDSMRDSRKKDFVNVVNTCRDIFSKSGLGKVVSGNVTFTKLKGNALGYYRISTKDVQIDPASSQSNLKLLYVLIHEFSHKLMYEYISPSKVSEIGKKFNELKRSEHSSVVSPLTFKLGTLVHNTGTSSTWKGDWVVLGRTPKKITLGSVDDGRKCTGTVEAFLSSGFVFAGYDAPAVKLAITHVLSAQNSPSTDDWIPTKYAETNASEWFAECMTLYLTGKLHGDVKTFFDEILKGA